MNALTTTNARPLARPTSPPLSEALTSLLDSSGSPEAAVREIANTPALLSEVRDALPALKAVAEDKAGPEGVKAVVGRRAALYPPTYRNEAEAAAWWLDYYDVLSDLSLASLEAGMRAYVADPSSEFMPKPGKLRELAFSSPCRTLGRYYRARMAIQAAEDALAPPPQRADPAEVRTMLSGFQENIRIAPQATKRPPPCGEVDEGGLTPQMRNLMRRRAEQ